MNTTIKRQDGKSSYEPICCKVAEVKSQGVLCASIGQPDEQLTGGLNMYGGSAL